MKKLFLKSVLVLSVVLFSSSQIFSQWVKQASGTKASLKGIRAVNDNVVWACGTYGVVLKTIDGGTTWRLLTPTLATVTNYCIESFDTTTAWVTGTVAGSKGVSIWKTTDGGTTWTSQYNSPTGFGNGVRFFDANDGVYFGDPNPWPSSNWEILTTSNGGVYWNRVPRTNFPAADSVHGEAGCATSIDVVNDNVWFSANYYYAANPVHLYKSTDKGVNWTSYPIPLPSGINFTLLAFSSATNGAIGSASGRLGFTADGGATWNFTLIWDVSFRGITNVPGHNTFITVGYNGACYYSENFGPWASLTTGVDALLECIDATANYAWAAGTFGTILKLYGLPVPVELTSFTAAVIGKQVALNWSTATEINNRGFEIQRKALGGDFATVAFIEGQGTTTQKHEYSFSDKNLDAGKYFYRLKQIDFGGKYEYSQIVEINWRPFTTYKLEQNYPNPFNPTTTIGFGILEKGNVRMSVLNILGEEIKVLLNEEKEAGYHSIDFNGSNLPSGVYFYRLQVYPSNSGTGNFTDSKRMMLIK